MKFLSSLTLTALCAATLTAQTPPQTNTPTDAQILTAAQTQSSLACPGYTPDRGNLGIAAVPVAALRVLARHHFLLCPDTRLNADMAVLWYPKPGVFTWKPGDPAILKTLAEIVDRQTRLDDFPDAITVWDADDEELSNQNAPDFKLKDTSTRPE